MEFVQKKMMTVSKITDSKYFGRHIFFKHSMQHHSSDVCKKYFALNCKPITN